MSRSFPLLLTFVVAALMLSIGCGGGSPAGADRSPIITSIEPASGGAEGGTRIVIRGTNLANPQPGAYEVLVGGQPAATVVVIDDTEVECRTPPHPQGAADVEIVTLDGHGTAPGAFMFYPPPTVTSIDPSSGIRFGGTSVTLTGTGFTANDPGESLCFIDLKGLVDATVVDDTTIQGKTPSSWNETQKGVTVVNRNGTAVLPDAFQYTGPAPVISAITPTEGPRQGGTLATITGEHYTEVGGLLTVRFDEAEASSVTRIDDQTLTCITPASTLPGWKDVTVGNHNGESSLPDAFYYLPEPLPTAVDPNEGPYNGGTAVTITGESFTAGGAVTVLFGGVPATSVVVVDDTTITCVTPFGPVIGSVTVTTQNSIGQGSLPDGFTYLAPEFWWEQTFGPRLTSLTGWNVYQVVPLPYGFPFYGTLWSSTYCLSGGQLQFGNVVSVNQYIFDDIQPYPHITALSGLFNPVYSGSTIGIYATNHVPGRTIFTWDHVAEYSGLGANTFQLHLDSSGMFAIVFKDTTYNLQTGGYGVGVMCGLSNGLNNGATSVPVDWTSGPLSSGPTEAFNEIWQNSQSGDLDNCVLIFYPNAAGGYDSIYMPSVPSDPHP